MILIGSSIPSVISSVPDLCGVDFYRHTVKSLTTLKASTGTLVAFLVFLKPAAEGGVSASFGPMQLTDDLGLDADSGPWPGCLSRNAESSGYS